MEDQHVTFGTNLAHNETPAIFPFIRRRMIRINLLLKERLINGFGYAGLAA